MYNRILKLRHAAKQARATGGRGYLYTPEGKRLLKDARAFDLRWPELTRTFARSKGCLEKILSFHGLRKDRPRFINWNERLLSLVKAYYRRSQELSNGHESAQLTGEMAEAVNKERKRVGLNPVSINAIRCFAKGYGLVWGYHTRTAVPQEQKNANREDRDYLKLL